MINCKKHIKSLQVIRLLITVCCLVSLSSCRFILITLNKLSPKQGDNITAKITIGESEHMAHTKYKIGNKEGTITTAPYSVSVNTCKETGQYLTSLEVWGEVTYNDGEVLTFGPMVYNLTVGETYREDNDLTYSIYIAEDDDEDREDLRIGIANAFMDEFDSYSQSQYYWSEPYFYTTQAVNWANSVEMAIAFGHGSHHHYKAGKSSSDWVNLSTTEFGSCAPCYHTGDCEYLVFASCQTLSMADYGVHSFWYYWFHNSNTKLNERPFTGLHMVLGFRTNHRIVYWWFDNDSEDFFEAFAENLDNNMSVIDSWQEAAGDELSFDDGKNRTAVIYLKKYEGDIISYNKDDYIHGNANYYDQWIDYWE